MKKVYNSVALHYVGNSDGGREERIDEAKERTKEEGRERGREGGEWGGRGRKGTDRRKERARTLR